MSETRAAAVTDAQSGLRLDRAMGELFPEHSRSALARLIEEGRASVDGKVVTKPSQRVEPGQTITLDVPPPLPLHSSRRTSPSRSSMKTKISSSSTSRPRSSFIRRPVMPTALS